MMARQQPTPSALQRFLQGRFVRSAVPMVALVVAGSVGLSYLVESKMQVKSGIRGYHKVEEYDPMSAVRQREAQPAADPISSLEDELREVQEKVDINNFDYVPVPRQDEDED